MIGCVHMYSKEELEQRRAALSTSKRELLQQHLHGLPAAPASTMVSARSIPPRPADAAIPLSCIQERFWFLQQLDPASVSYVNVSVYQLTGPINDGALVRAVEGL